MSKRSQSREPGASGYTPEAWEFMREHPGGLDREFFVDILPRFAVEYGEHRSLKAGEGEIEVLLSSGEILSIAGVRVGLTFVVLLTDDDEMVATPLRNILRVTVRRRPATAPPKKAPLGFSVEVIESQQQR
jgi:hypothetical protein